MVMRPHVVVKDLRCPKIHAVTLRLGRSGALTILNNCVSDVVLQTN
jgi:hypothetical protein